MKKLILGSIIAIALLLVSACANSVVANPDTITNANLTHKESVFLSLGSSQYFAFDYDADNTYKSVDIWIDRYEYGKFVTCSGKLSTQLVPGEKGMLVAMVKEKEQGTSEWTTAIITGSSVSTGKSTQTFSLKETSSVNSATSINPSVIKIEDKETALAGICYTAGDGMISSLSEDFFNDPEQHLNDISGIDLVYIVKCRFSKTVK